MIFENYILKEVEKFAVIIYYVYTLSGEDLPGGARGLIFIALRRSNASAMVV